MFQTDTVGATAPGQPFGFADVVRLLRDRGLVVRNITLGSVLITLLALLAWPSSYSATAVVMLDPRKNNITDRSQVLSELPTDPASVQNQIQILTSRDLALQIISRLSLAKDKEFNGALAPFPLNFRSWGLSPDEQQSMIIDGFLKRLTAEAEGLSTAVSVSFKAGDPEKSARITNAIVDAYVEDQVAQKAEAAERTTQWLAQRIRELGTQVQAADAEVQDYKAANGLNDSGQGTQSLVDQQLAAINAQLVQAEADLAAKEATYGHVSELVQSGRAADVSQVVSSQLIVQLRQQQADAIRNKADLDSRYGPRHPKRIAAESQLRDLESKIEQEAERIAGSVANDAAVGRAQVRSLEASLARTRDESNAQNLARVKLRALEASAASTRGIYEAFVTRLRETQDQDAVDTADARIISHATVPARPSSPPRFIISVASIPAGFLLGLLCALVMERAGYETTRRAGGVQVRSAAVPVVGVVSGALAPLAADQIVSKPSSSFARAVFAIAQQFAATRSGEAPKIVLVSGFDRREGRTNVAVGLARALAVSGRKVVVVDADFGAPGAARAMGANGENPGLLEVLRGRAPLSHALAKDLRSPALVLWSVTVPQSPSQLWTARETQGLFGHLRRTCDFIIIDCPAGPEMPQIARLADGVLLVAMSASTATLQKTAGALAADGALVGVVLTR